MFHAAHHPPHQRLRRCGKNYRIFFACWYLSFFHSDHRSSDARERIRCSSNSQLRASAMGLTPTSPKIELLVGASGPAIGSGLFYAIPSMDLHVYWRAQDNGSHICAKLRGQPVKRQGTILKRRNS